MSLQFGLFVPQGWCMDLVGIADPVEAYETMARVAREAEALGYHSVWLFDHFHTVPAPTQEVTFECWTSTAALARDTRRVRIGQMVTCNGYRHPALLAKMASTVDVLSHGRLDFGIGAGWYEHEYRAYGYDYTDVSERLRALREAVQVILAMWTQDEARFEGSYYQVRGAINQPKGVQHPHIPLLIGGSGEQVTLKLVAQYADACNITNPDIATLEHELAILKKQCEALGRDYESIKRTVLLMCAIAETDEQAALKIGSIERDAQGQADLSRVRERALIGTPETIRRRLASYEQQAHRKLSCICRTQQHWNRYDCLRERVWVHKEQSGSTPGGSSLFSCRLHGGSVPADYLHMRRNSPPGCDMLHLTVHPMLPDCRYDFRPAQCMCTYRFGEAPYPYHSACRLKEGEQNSSDLKWLLPNTWRHVPNVI